METREEEVAELDRQHQQMTGLISLLPMELILDILSQLPAKTLSQCRWVSKPWYNLISNPRFILLHHTKSILNNSPSLIHCDSKWDYYMIDHQSLQFPQTLSTPSYRVLNQRQQKYYYTVVGSCGGFLCLRSEPFYFICNPITGEQIQLPDSPNYNSIDYYTSGFGNDPIRNEFKVVRINKKRHRLLEAEICTLGPGCSWRKIPNVDFFCPANTKNHVNHNVFFHGFIHWLGYKPAEQGRNHIVPGAALWGANLFGMWQTTVGSMVIVSIDMRSEEFGYTSLPSTIDYGAENSKENSYLGVLGECLCFLDGFDYTNCTDVWVMKEYGVETSWMKQWVISGESVPGPIGMAYDFVKVKEDDELFLLFNNKDLGYYDPQKEAFTPILVEGINVLSRYMLPIAHVESLISPRDIARLKKSQ